MTVPIPPVAALLRERIARDGPLGVDAFMALCLGHPEHGYYMSGDRIGARGDFVTAPEISQMFGEMIGLWCAVEWQRMGAPREVRLVELGPGHGTLMRDALRATANVPGFHDALTLHLVEISPVMRARQAAALAAAAPRWHDTADGVPDGPLLVIANEFFDALPVRQFVRAANGWVERKVGLDAAGALVFLADPAAPAPAGLIPPALDTATPGSVVEIAEAARAVMDTLARRLARDGGAAIVTDYGYVGPAAGDTLQAVRGHAHADALAEPGLADLTTQVDFAALAATAHAAGARCFGPVTQGGFLRALGIDARAAMLKLRATPAQAGAIDAALVRLTAPNQMGRLFKTLAVVSGGQEPPAGFDFADFAASPHSKPEGR